MCVVCDFNSGGTLARNESPKKIQNWTIQLNLQVKWIRSTIVRGQPIRPIAAIKPIGAADSNLKHWRWGICIFGTKPTPFCLDTFFMFFFSFSLSLTVSIDRFTSVSLYNPSHPPLDFFISGGAEGFLFWFHSSVARFSTWSILIFRWSTDNLRQFASFFILGEIVAPFLLFQCGYVLLDLLVFPLTWSTHFDLKPQFIVVS